MDVRFLVSPATLSTASDLVWTGCVGCMVAADTSQDVNFPEATLSGYLSISHLTDAHPHLTTFFTGEIIGPKNGFITGSRFGATEHDDMRHWGRFEQFRRPSTRADMIRPELLFRDPLPDRNRGETRAKERDFVFLRIKERFLVPDHTVRDISGASFAGESIITRLFSLLIVMKGSISPWSTSHRVSNLRWTSRPLRPPRSHRSRRSYLRARP